jgi:hypothetical protein
VGIIPLLPIAFLGLLGLVVLILIPAAWLIHRTSPAIASLWRSTIVVWTGRAAMLALTAVSLVALVRNVSAIL